ncbi:S-protein-like protein 5 [Bienertia sinuspersici]
MKQAMVIILLLAYLQAIVAPQAEIRVTNMLVGSTQLQIHCKSKDEDLGVHVIPNQGVSNENEYPILDLELGAGNRNFISILKDLVHTNQPNVLVLVEPHMGGEQAENIASIIGYSGHERVDGVGFSGGIWFIGGWGLSL